MIASTILDNTLNMIITPFRCIASRSHSMIIISKVLTFVNPCNIIEIAKKIDTFETSIIPEEDCCSVFAPKKPVTKPKLERIEDSEKALDVDKLIQDAIDNMEVEVIEF